jgi:hypothetical protein
MTFGGCSYRAEAETAAQRTSFNSSTPRDTVLDIGVILRGRPTYVCYPLTRFRIDDPDDLVAIETSCECVQAETETYISAGGAEVAGLMLRFAATQKQSEASSLWTEVILRRKNASDVPLSVRFLLTGEPASNDADELQHAAGPTVGAL